MKVENPQIKVSNNPLFIQNADKPPLNKINNNLNAKAQLLTKRFEDVKNLIIPAS